MEKTDDHLARVYRSRNSLRGSRHVSGVIRTQRAHDDRPRAIVKRQASHAERREPKFVGKRVVKREIESDARRQPAGIEVGNQVCQTVEFLGSGPRAGRPFSVHLESRVP
jgi:hypothetical protein